MRPFDAEAVIPINTIQRLSKRRIPDYESIRKELENVSSLCPQTRCRQGNGWCCKGEVQVTDGDKEMLGRAIQKREIPREVVEEAVKNAFDDNRTDCPFLDTTTRRCTIYPVRPIVCMAFGNNAMRLTPAKRNDGGGLVKTIDTIIFSCAWCSESFPTQLPRECVNAAEDAHALTIQESMGKHGGKLKPLETLRQYIRTTRLGLSRGK